MRFKFAFNCSSICFRRLLLVVVVVVVVEEIGIYSSRICIESKRKKEIEYMRGKRSENERKKEREFILIFQDTVINNNNC